MFDCVLPTRNARNGNLFTWQGLVKLRNAKYRQDLSPLDPNCPCFACSRGLTRAYLAHLSRAKELSFFSMATLHNLTFYQQLMSRIREAIRAGELTAFAHEVEALFP